MCLAILLSHQISSYNLQGFHHMFLLNNVTWKVNDASSATWKSHLENSQPLACVIRLYKTEKKNCHFFTVRDPPYCDFFFNRNVVLIAQNKRFGTLNATQKSTALYKAPFLKKSRKTARNWPFLTNRAFLTFQAVFPDSSQDRCFVEGCGFLRCVQCPKTLYLSYQKQHSEKI